MLLPSFGASEGASETAFVELTSILQTSNNTYTVNKLPALPDRIRADSAGEYDACDLYCLC